jgi:hypothetical protein
LSPAAETIVVLIQDDDLLYRRLSSIGHLRPDRSVNSNAYKFNREPDPEPSVDLSKLTSPKESLARAPNENFVLGVLRAGDIRGLGLDVTHRPIVDGPKRNPAHSVILGNVSRETCRQLADITYVLDLTGKQGLEGTGR